MQLDLTAKPEAEIERLVLRAVGLTPDLWIAKNEVGQFYKPSILKALSAALKPFGAKAVAAAMNVISRSKITVGLGTGSPDLVGSLRGHFFGWELKTEIGRTSPEQDDWHAAARAKGMRVDVIRSADEALEKLSEMQKEWR
jgi:hypothetical protein